MPIPFDLPDDDALENCVYFTAEQLDRLLADAKAGRLPLPDKSPDWNRNY